MKCATEGCNRTVERPPPCTYCEECSYDLMGEVVEKHPLGGHLCGQLNACAPSGARRTRGKDHEAS